ncbi:rho GTPase-activating protein 18-like [Babylonia areolata]|uniref:rho GTPase-activating protein 18-like n=1 Tax=Babylonia areolata TaxID=304850 RepID=UPI003FD41801
MASATAQGRGQGQGQGQGEVLDDYWRECHDIEQNKDGEMEEEEVSKTPDEGEVEAQWLKDAGYGFIVSKVSDGRDLSDDELEAVTSTLTPHQADAVKRRVNSLSTTLRRKKAGKLHVKDIFPTPDNSSPEPPSPGSMVDEPVMSSGEDNSMVPDRSSLLPHKGEYNVENVSTEPPKLMEGVEALSFKERGSLHKPYSRTPSNRSIGSSLPAISDADISIDFHLEQKDSQKSQQGKDQPDLDPKSEDLPLFEAKNDPLGVTLIGDLSDVDMPKIRSLALIELTALFDLYDITYTRHKRKKKPKEHGLFGVPIQVLLEQDQKRVPGTRVPIFFQQLVNHLEQEALKMEGILRVPGSVTRVKNLRQDIEEKFYQGTFCWTDVMPHDSAALLKQFLRELPVPILSYQYLEAFSQVEHINKKLEQLKALNLLILLLPTEHQDLLKRLLEFLGNIVSHAHINKMGLSNVAMIMAPNLFVAPASKGKMKTTGQLELTKAANTSSVVAMLIHYRHVLWMLELTKAANTSSVVAMLIHYRHVLWMIPSSFLTQVRHQYKTEASRKARMRPWRRKDKSEAYKKSPSESENQEGMIRVQAPDLTKNSCLIQLDDYITAGDIVAKFRRDYCVSSQRDHSDAHQQETKKSGSSHPFNNPHTAQFADDKAYLYEIGGNIGERCLDPQTRMLQLYHINPSADWVIRVNVER